MKKNFLIIAVLLTFIAKDANSQDFIDKEPKKISIGVNIGDDMTCFIINPEATYYIYKNIGVGLSYMQGMPYNISTEKLKEMGVEDQMEIGLHVKYVCPYFINKPFLKRFRLYAQGGINIANYYFADENTIEKPYISTDLSVCKLRLIPVALKFNIYKGLNLNLLLANNVSFSNEDPNFSQDIRIGLHYDF